MKEAIPCAECKSVPHVIRPQVITSGPAKGVRISKAWVVCKCGWQTPKRESIGLAIDTWNYVMGHRRLKE